MSKVLLQKSFGFRVTEEEFQKLNNLLDKVHEKINSQRDASSYAVKKGEILGSLVEEGLKDLLNSKTKYKRRSE